MSTHKTSRTERALGLGVLFVLLVIVLLAFFAVKSVNYPTNSYGSEEAEQSQGDQQPNESFWRPSTYGPVTFFTAVLAFIGLCQAGLFWWQLFLIRKGLVDTGDVSAQPG